MFVRIQTGADARVAGADAISSDDLGVRFSGFRTLDRFDEQVEGMNIGHVSWPGGALAEAYPDRFGLNYDGLFNPALGQPGLSEMMEYCVENDCTLSVVLPTARYANDLGQLRADMQEFMGDLLAGDYGPVPAGMFFHIGSEHYAHFVGLTPDGAAAGYGRVAAAMVEEITAALDDPSVNRIAADIKVAVQAGRSIREDEVIRGSFDDEVLAEVDMVTHHRYAAQADGIDGMLRKFRPINEAWQDDVVRAGGEETQINLGEWNVASVTRSEALSRYIRDEAQEGHKVARSDVDLEGRTTTDFEQYWQRLLDTRDYGAGQPQLYLEMFSEYVAEGLGAGSLHAIDLMHAGRATYTDAAGNPVQFVGGDMIEMIYESVEGTNVLKISEQNKSSAPMSTYGFASDDRLVVFLAADEGVTLGDVTLNIEGLSEGYAAVFVDNLVAEVPDDWMTRFGIPDNAQVDESSEGQTYAMGVRGDLPARINGDQLSVRLTHPGEVVRVVIARTPEEAARIADWAGAPDYTLGTDDDTAEPPTDPVVVPTVPPAPVVLQPGDGLPPVPQPTPEPRPPAAETGWASEDLFARNFLARLQPLHKASTVSFTTETAGGELPPLEAAQTGASAPGASGGSDAGTGPASGQTFLGNRFQPEIDPPQGDGDLLPAEFATATVSSLVAVPRHYPAASAAAESGDADETSVDLLLSDTGTPAAAVDPQSDEDAAPSEDGAERSSFLGEANTVLNAISSMSLAGFLAAVLQHGF